MSIEIIAVLVTIIAVLVSIPSALVALSALRKTTGIGRTVKTWATGISAVGGRMAHRVTVIYQKADRRIAITKRRLVLHWTIWRKKVRLSIKSVFDQDMALQDASATSGERIGMAAIKLSQLLDNDPPFTQNIHKEVFKKIRATDAERFHMFCARIAADIVTNPKAQPDAPTPHYVVPWDSALEKFLKDALDEPTANESDGAAKSP